MITAQLLMIYLEEFADHPDFNQDTSREFCEGIYRTFLNRRIIFGMMYPKKTPKQKLAGKGLVPSCNCTYLFN